MENFITALCFQLQRAVAVGRRVGLGSLTISTGLPDRHSEYQQPINGPYKNRSTTDIRNIEYIGLANKWKLPSSGYNAISKCICASRCVHNERRCAVHHMWTSNRSVYVVSTYLVQYQIVSYACRLTYLKKNNCHFSVKHDEKGDITWKRPKSISLSVSLFTLFSHFSYIYLYILYKTIWQ